MSPTPVGSQPCSSRNQQHKRSSWSAGNNRLGDHVLAAPRGKVWVCMLISSTEFAWRKSQRGSLSHSPACTILSNVAWAGLVFTELLLSPKYPTKGACHHSQLPPSWLLPAEMSLPCSWPAYQGSQHYVKCFGGLSLRSPDSSQRQGLWSSSIPWWGD